MEDKEQGTWLERREARGREADVARAAAIATIGTELMNAFNHGKTDPSDMATHGQDTSTGFQFCIERNGVVYTWSGTRDLDT